MKKLLISSVLTLSSLFILPAQASLVLESYGSGETPLLIGGNEMVDFAFNEPGLPTSTVNSPISGSLSFEDRHGNPLNMTDTDADYLEWWNNNEDENYNAYTTNQSWLKIILPENTLAFSFSVGADLNNGRGWLTGTDSNGLGLSNVTRQDGREYFDVNRNYSPSFGIYADNSQAATGECSYVSSVVIDPDYWGVGNFSIAQGECTNNVPEPSMIALMSLGFVGMGFMRRKQKV